MTLSDFSSPLYNSLMQALSIARLLGDKEGETWIVKELEGGYEDKDELPEYRYYNEIAIQKSIEINRAVGYQIKKTIPKGQVEFPCYFPISEIEALSKQTSVEKTRVIDNIPIPIQWLGVDFQRIKMAVSNRLNKFLIDSMRSLQLQSSINKIADKERLPISLEIKQELSQMEYERILVVLTSVGLAIERSPTTFDNMKEEEIRNIFLIFLNGYFPGKATGETFNAHGKTDILVRWEDQNIFIAECKFWRGQRKFQEAIDQLFNYLTWRDTKAALLIFNKNQNLSQVIDTVKQTFGSHNNLKSQKILNDPTLLQETIICNTLKHPRNNNRDLTLTTMFFDIET
ncbi:MAG: hypothetical protein ACFFC7_17135 [Candidatus Hermodarchaeota archaeon]